MKLKDVFPKFDFVKLILAHKKAKRSAARWAPVCSKTVKILILGLDEVGKTSLVAKLCGRDVKENNERTLYDVYETEIAVDECSVRFQFMDLASPYVFPTMLDVFIQQADMFLLVYSADNGNSFDELTKLRNQVARVKSRHTTQLPIVVVNNKVDVAVPKLTKKGYQRRKSVSNWCSQAIDVSAKTGYNVNAVMETLIKESKFIGNKDEPVGEPSVSGTYIYGGEDPADVGAGELADGSGKSATRSKSRRSTSIQYHRGSSMLKCRVNSLTAGRRRQSAGNVMPVHHVAKQQRSRSFDFSMLRRSSRGEIETKQARDHSVQSSAVSCPSSAPADSTRTPSNLTGPVSGSPRQDGKVPSRKISVSPFPCSYALALSMRARCSLSRASSESSILQASGVNTPRQERRSLNTSCKDLPEDIARTQSVRAGAFSKEPAHAARARCRSTGELSEEMLPGLDLTPPTVRNGSPVTRAQSSDSSGLSDACGANVNVEETLELGGLSETVVLRKKRKCMRRLAVTDAPAPSIIQGTLGSSPVANREDRDANQFVSKRAETRSAFRRPSSFQAEH